MDDFNIHLRNVLFIMILVMIIYVILAIVYSAAIEFSKSNPLYVSDTPVYQFGDVINSSSDILTNTVNTIMAIFNGTVHLIGHLLNEFARPYNNPSATAMPGITPDMLSKQSNINLSDSSLKKVAVAAAVAAKAAAEVVKSPLGTRQIPTQTKKIEKFDTILDDRINNGKNSIWDLTAETDTTTSVIQNNKAPKTTNWCYIGKMKGDRGCVEMNGEYDKCPGILYTDKETCVSSTDAKNENNFLKSKFTKNVKKEKRKIE